MNNNENYQNNNENNQNKSRISINTINDIEVKEKTDDSRDYNGNYEMGLYLNSENKEFFVKRILMENKEYKNYFISSKSEEVEINNYIYQLEIELENFSKFKNFFITKINSTEENIVLCRKSIDNFCEKICNVQVDLEFLELVKKKSLKKNKALF